MNSKLFGAQLKRRRKELNLTMEQLAEMLNISVTSLNNAESGSNYFSMKNFIQCCEVLKVHPNYFFTYAYDDTYKNIDEEELEIVKSFLDTGLTAEDRKVLHRLLTSNKDAIKLILEMYHVLDKYHK